VTPQKLKIGNDFYYPDFIRLLCPYFVPMPDNLSTIILIDADEIAAVELAALLNSRKDGLRVLMFSTVRDAACTLRGGVVEWLFIRITAWDDYQLLAHTLPSLPRRVVFLSGRNEKCTGHLASTVDGHLQPSYRAGHLAKVWNRMSDPHFIPLPLDIFFIKCKARYQPVRYCDIKEVSRESGQLRIETRDGEYLVAGSLQAFQERLPVPLAHTSRGCLVNEAYQSGWWPMMKIRAGLSF
jgi:DNA-binding LytR/AlgR family response regulator